MDGEDRRGLSLIVVIAESQTQGGHRPMSWRVKNDCWIEKGEIR